MATKHIESLADSDVMFSGSRASTRAFEASLSPKQRARRNSLATAAEKARYRKDVESRRAKKTERLAAAKKAERAAARAAKKAANAPKKVGGKRLPAKKKRS